MIRYRLEKRYKSSWTIIFDFGIDPIDKKRKRKSVSFKGKKPDAEAYAKNLLLQYEQGIEAIDSTKILTKDYLTRWLNDYVKLQVSPKTYQRYKQIVENRLIPKLGNIPITKLNPMHLQNFYKSLMTNGRLDGKQGELSNNSIIYCHRVLHRALEIAVKWQIVQRNVANVVDPPKKEHSEIQILDENQLKWLLDKLKNTCYYEVVYLASYTGMRRSELLGLRWKDIDFKNKTINIVQALSYTKEDGYILKEPKSKNSKRRIDIGDSVIKLLEEYKVKYEKQKEENKNIFQDYDLIFCQVNGHPLHPDTISKWFIKQIKNTDLPQISFHDLRHTHASILLKQGVHPKIVSERLGHSSVSFTLDVYSHLLPGVQKKAVEDFDKFLK